jgi:hypothetical protein
MGGSCSFPGKSPKEKKKVVRVNTISRNSNTNLNNNVKIKIIFFL